MCVCACACACTYCTCLATLGSYYYTFVNAPHTLSLSLSLLSPSHSLCVSDDYPVEHVVNPVALGPRWLALTETQVHNTSLSSKTPNTPTLYLYLSLQLSVRYSSRGGVSLSQLPSVTTAVLKNVRKGLSAISEANTHTHTHTTHTHTHTHTHTLHTHTLHTHTLHTHTHTHTHAHTHTHYTHTHTLHTHTLQVTHSLVSLEWSNHLPNLQILNLR